jgi:hypothetical protein
MPKLEAIPALARNDIPILWLSPGGKVPTVAESVAESGADKVLPGPQPTAAPGPEWSLCHQERRGHPNRPSATLDESVEGHPCPRPENRTAASTFRVEVAHAE